MSQIGILRKQKSDISKPFNIYKYCIKHINKYIFFNRIFYVLVFILILSKPIPILVAIRSNR